MSPAGPDSAKQKAQLNGYGLGGHLANIYCLMIKELRSIRADPVMLILVVYSFSIAVYTIATGASTEPTNLAVGVVDEDRSELSRRIADGLTPPLFKPAAEIVATDMDVAMNAGHLVFIIEIPSNSIATLTRQK
jgi:ABC-2 type transport system permease protein